MTKLAFLVTICFVGSKAIRFDDKLYYDLEYAEGLYHDFMKEHGKSYRPKEYFERLEIFNKSLKYINRLNAKYPKTVFAVNHFADLKPEEHDKYHGFKLNEGNKTRVKVRERVPDSLVAPTNFDWRDHGVVSHVKDQVHCGSCYIFSAMGNIEGQYAMKHNQCIALSEGQALDCLDYCTCEGGAMHEVMKALVDKPGVMKEEDYPYKDKKGTCHEDSKKGVARVLEGQPLDVPDEDVLLQQLLEIGPLAVGIVADDQFNYYKSGIMYPNDRCSGGRLNHAMLLVGYGEDEDQVGYWIIKNSWGKKWGEDGYLRLLRGVNACHMGTRYTAISIVA